jgi:DNA-binding phage protein
VYVVSKSYHYLHRSFEDDNPELLQKALQDMSALISIATVTECVVSYIDQHEPI